jgi:hypothetical protein
MSAVTGPRSKAVRDALLAPDATSRSRLGNWAYCFCCGKRGTPLSYTVLCVNPDRNRTNDPVQTEYFCAAHTDLPGTEPVYAATPVPRPTLRELALQAPAPSRGTGGRGAPRGRYELVDGELVEVRVVRTESTGPRPLPLGRGMLANVARWDNGRVQNKPMKVKSTRKMGRAEPQWVALQARLAVKPFEKTGGVTGLTGTKVGIHGTVPAKGAGKVRGYTVGP